MKLLFANQTHISRSCGFTLVELIISMSITVLVAGSTAVILANVSTARQRSEQHFTNAQDANFALHAIVTSLRNAYRPVGEDQSMLEGIDDWAGDEPSDRIRFFTVSKRSIRSDQPESDVREVEYFVSMPDDGLPPALMRRIDPTRNEIPDGGGVVERISNNVVSLNLEFYDGVQWQTEWSPEMRQWPMLIRVELGIVADNKRHLLRYIRKTVNFPHWPETKRQGR